MPEPTPAPLVTIIVLHWRGVDRTTACLHSLATLAYPNYRVLLVDNGALPHEMQQLRQTFPDVPVLQTHRNLGFAGGVNAALRQTLAGTSSYVLLLNNDTLVPADLLTRLIAVMQQHPQVGILTPKLRRADAPHRLAGLGCRVTWYDVVPSGWNTPDTADEQQLLYFDAVFGSAMLISRAVLAQVGLFDERFFFYYEDIDLCVRARQHGFQIACDPAVSVVHAVAASTRRAPGLRMFYMGRSRRLFFYKHQSLLARIAMLATEPIHLVRVAWAHWRQVGDMTDALGYVSGNLVGLVQTLQ
ncbi:MAG: glycosyltransferase family 2 protein [Chloroflexaceae bacterium]|nr:glycosyltransferase family 2 protein [Chloroflexaceae bacterium]